MSSEYTQDQVHKALNEILNDEKARDEMWKDICGVMAKHVTQWLTRSQQSRERVEGIVIKKKNYSRIQCPKCKSISPADSVFCTHCCVQVQDSWLETIRKENRR